MNIREQRDAFEWLPQIRSPRIFLLVCFLFLEFALQACGTGSSLSRENKPAESNREKRGPVIYVALGDSTGIGVGAREGGYVSRLFQRIDHERPSSQLTNLCTSGATSSDVVREQLERAVAAHPTLVTIGIGINDISRSVTEQTFASNLEEIVSRLKSKTTASIVITNLPDVSLAPIVPGSLREQLHNRILSFNQKVKETADRHGLLQVDAYTATHDMIPSHPEFFSFDGFHPSDEGYEFWAKLMWPTVKEAIEK